MQYCSIAVLHAQRNSYIHLSVQTGSLIFKCVTGLACTTVLFPETAALAAAQVFAVSDATLWSRLRVRLTVSAWLPVMQADADLLAASATTGAPATAASGGAASNGAGAHGAVALAVAAKVLADAPADAEKDARSKATV